MSELLTRGLDTDDNPGIQPLTEPGKPPETIPQAALDFEALFDLLTDVVLRDQILVDDQFHAAWFGDGGALGELARRSILRPHPFLEHADRLTGPRAEFVRRLVLNDTMAKEQAANERAWDARIAAPHVFTSQLVWGGAGMLARAFVNEAPYTPHPLRRRLFEQAKVVIPVPPVALDEFQEAFAEQRASLSHPSMAKDVLVGWDVLLPPVPALVLRDATAASDIFKVAAQMRDELGPMRAWLSQFQEAISSGDLKAIARERKLLSAIRKEADRALGVRGANSPTLNVGLSLLKVSWKFDIPTWMPKWNRVQIQANTLTFAPSGQAELRKLLGFFGHGQSTVGLRTIEHFCRR